ncbi:MAG TPA: porin, partial [Xanthobacteraceae bacterium]
MKVTKSLLLGAAAGLVALSGAQAADLPVKAKPVEYVKICSAYGAGFYYIPGTDICLRVGGYVFAEFGAKATAANASIYSAAGTAAVID